MLTERRMRVLRLLVAVRHGHGPVLDSTERRMLADGATPTNLAEALGFGRESSAVSDALAALVRSGLAVRESARPGRVVYAATTAGVVESDVGYDPEDEVDAAVRPLARWLRSLGLDPVGSGADNGRPFVQCAVQPSRLVGVAQRLLESVRSSGFVAEVRGDYNPEDEVATVSLLPDDLDDAVRAVDDGEVDMADAVLAASVATREVLR